MAASRTTQSYVYGNVVRKERPQQRVPSERIQHLEHQANVSRRVRRNQEKALHMDLPYVFCLTIAAICALYICVNYLHVQSSITSRIHNIETLEQSIETMRSENNALETRINTYVDLDHVYKVATEDLGMVYANKNQVLLYNKTESEYVRQYEDIPKH